MLLAAGISQGTIDGWVKQIEFEAGKDAVAYGNGSPLLPCFQLIHRQPPARVRPRVIYGGCVGY